MISTMRMIAIYACLFAGAWTVLAQTSPLPAWLDAVQMKETMLQLEIPRDLNQPFKPEKDIQYLLLTVEKTWRPEWRDASFTLKNLIVELKAAGGDVRVALEATEEQAAAMTANGLDPYIDAYLFEDTPFIPEGDATGKLWQRVRVEETEVLHELIGASSIGVEMVLFEGITVNAEHRGLLEVIAGAQTGSLDIQPTTSGIPPKQVQFFFDPAGGNYHLAVYAEKDQIQNLLIDLDQEVNVTLLYPEKAGYRFSMKRNRGELRLRGLASYYFFLLEPVNPVGAGESLSIIEKKSIDPYELVVKNQVFRDREDKRFKSLEVEEALNYRYQNPQGGTIDVTFVDTVVLRKGEPTERIRKELFFGGVKWPYDELPDLPLIEPEKVQREPLTINLDKTYTYTYEGEDQIDGHATWKVGFKPIGEGDFLSGTVWIDQQTGAHRRVRAVQSGLEAPVVGNEVTAYFDWVEDRGEKYWIQVREANVQLINIAGLRIALQIDAERSGFKFNRPELQEVLDEAYASNITILRDTAKGFRYLKKKDGERVVDDSPGTAKKLALGGVFFDPALDYPIPLGGINYTNLDFRGTGTQMNLFIAGAVNDLIFSNPDFLGRGWDLTAELFATALYFGDSIYENGEEREDLEVETLRQSFNLTLGIPVTSFFKMSFNYALRYWDYKRADDTAENFVLPEQTLEHIGRVLLQYDRRRFATELEFEQGTRADWEPFGSPDSFEPYEDTYRKLRFDVSLSKKLPNFQNLTLDTRYLKGWDLDRFSQFGFGFFENTVSGFGTSGVKADEAVRLRLGYDVGVKELFQLNVSLDGARAWQQRFDLDGLELEQDPVDLVGLGLAANFVGPWKTILRAKVGYGLASDLEGEEGNVTGQIVFLKLF